jgi:hypothetical protein
MFTFSLRDKDGNVLDIAENKADGSVTFTTIDFDQYNAGDHYVFYIDEINDAKTITDGNSVERQIIYDDHAGKIEFDVIDIGESELQIIPEYEANIFTNRVLSDLTISKTVKGNGGDINNEFDFTVTIGNLSGTYQTVDQNSTSGTIVLTNGEGHLTLSHGESITIKDIPVGTAYDVSEASYEDYRITSSGSSGTIILDGAVASFTNTKTVDIPTGINENINNIYYILTVLMTLIFAMFINKKSKKNFF